MELNTLINKILTAKQNPLANIQDIITALNISPNYPIILVGGTNGKGSVCAYLTTILTIAGFRVGTYTSPHVFAYNERICINNQPVDDLVLADALSKVMNKIESIGLFKTFTLAAHLIFIQQKIDIAIIEVGIGGRHDITNLFEPTISAITNVNLDHCEILGNTLDEIGYEKAGIYRQARPGFYGSQNPPPRLIEYAKQIGCKLQIFGTDFGVNRHELSFDVRCNNKTYYSLPYPALRGDNQPDNVALCLAILNQIHNDFPVSLGMIKTGLLQTKLIGRFQVLPGTPQIILDVAHNPHSVTNMLSNMLKLPFAPQNIAVFGIAQDKDVVQVIRQCKGNFDKWFIAKTNNIRGMDSNCIAKILTDNGVNKQNIIQCTTISEAYQNASLLSDARIICFGSFLVVEEAYNTIMSNRSDSKQG